MAEGMKRRRKIAVLLGTVAAVTIGGAAYALWSANGSGPAGSKALTAQLLTVAGATPTADLYPGFTGGDLFFTVNNPNPYAVTLTSMTPGAITSSDPSACPTSNITVANASGLTLSVPAASTSAPLTIQNVVTMVSGAPDGCQGIDFTVALTLAGSQS